MSEPTSDELARQVEELKRECTAWREELARERIVRGVYERSQEALMQVWKSNVESVGYSFRDKMITDAESYRKDLLNTGKSVRESSVLFGIFGTVVVGAILTLMLNRSHDLVKAEVERVERYIHDSMNIATLEDRAFQDAKTSLARQVGTNIREKTTGLLLESLLHTKQDVERIAYEKGSPRFGEFDPDDAKVLLHRIDTMLIYYPKKLSDPLFSPQSTQALSLVVAGISNVANGDWRDADMLFEEAQRLDPKLPDSYILRYFRWALEETYAGSGEYFKPHEREMEEQLEKLSALPEDAWRDHPDARRLIAATPMLRKPRNYPDAKKRLEKEAQLFPHPRTLKMLAYAAWKDPSNHDPGEALKQLNRALSLDPSDLGVINDLLWFATHAGIKEEAWSLSNAFTYWRGCSQAFDQVLDYADRMSSQPSIRVYFNNLETLAEAYYVLWQDSGRVVTEIIENGTRETIVQNESLERLNRQKMTCRESALLCIRDCLKLSDVGSLKKKYEKERERLERMSKILNGQ